MKKISGFFLFISILILPAAAQTFGTAVQDGVNSPLINPAAMGVGNAGGFGYINRYTTDSGFDEDYDLIFSLGNLAYSYGNFYGSGRHLLAAGSELGPGTYGGISYQWMEESNDTGGLGLSLLFRPLDWLSLAVQGSDLTTDGYTQLGLGVRPLFFTGNWTSRFTLSADLRIQDGESQGLTFGSFLEPLKGLKLYGAYDLDAEQFLAGAALSLSHLETGTTMDDKGESGAFQAFVPFKRLRSVADYTAGRAVEYDLADVILDTPVQGYIPGVFKKGTRTLVDFILDMEVLKNDPSVRAVIFRDQDFKTNFANILEIEKILLDLKKSGKKIYFYSSSIGNLPYALSASVADGIFLNPAGMIRLTGFSMTNVYLKDFFAEWGIKVNNYQSHDYKTAYNSLSESSMTDAEKEALQYLYDGLQKEMNRMIEEGRQEKLQASVQSVIDQGPFIYASKALKLGLVDKLLYEDEFDRFIRQNRLYPARASMTPGNFIYDWDASSKPVIEIIYARGNIKMGDGVAGESIGADSMVSAIRNARKNPLVKGIIFRVESGGGSTLASDLIAREIALCREGDHPKPVIVSMGGTAASGGYYISAPAAVLVASPVTVTGSIGVIAVMPEISGLLEKYGIGVGSVKTAEHADTGSVLKPVTPDEDAMMREYIAESYDRFITLVGEYRNLPVEEVHASAQGRVWTGEQAAERKLVDANGGLTTAFSLMKETLGTRNEIRLVEVVPGRNPSLLERSVNLPLLNRIRSQEKLPLPQDILDLMKMYEKLKEFEDEGALYLMPYTPEELGVSAR